MNPLTIGSAELYRVEEMTDKMPMAALTADDGIIKRHSDWLSPAFLDGNGDWELVYQSWILVHHGRVVVVDPCVGNGREIPAFPVFDNLDTPYLERFAATGFKPEDVDVVFCTHLHADHCGWNTRLRGGKYVPTFPNARYILTRRELERWDTRRPDYVENPLNKGVFENSVLPVLEAGLADVVEGNHRILPGLAVEPARGHTAGHAVAHLESDGREACFSGDVFHHPLELVCPDLELGAAEDLPTLLTTRDRLTDRFLRRNTLIVPAHFPSPHVGYLRQEKDRRVFSPGI